MRFSRASRSFLALAIASVASTCGDSTGPDFGPAAKLAFTVQPSNVVAGAAITPAVQVTVQDAQGNTVTTSTASVALVITSGSGTSGATLGGTLTQAAVAGVATFSSLTIDKAGSGYTLTATATSLTSATSVAFGVTPGAAIKLAFTVQPSAVVAGAAISPAVQVTVQDAQGNTATGSTASITVAITSGTGTTAAVPGGTLTQAAVAGVATFGNLTVDKAGSGYTLTATAAGLTSATSTAFGVSPGAAAKLAFLAQPSNATAGAAIAPAVQVVVQDTQGNTVTAATTSVTLAITSGTGTSGALLGGTLTQATVSGVATFSTLTIDKAGSGYTLTATATSLTSATSSAFNVAPGAATKLVFTVQPSNVAAGAAITPAVQVVVQDAQGNTATGSTASITVAIAGGTGTSGAVLGGTLTRAAVNGVATFSNLTIDKVGAGYTLTATATGLISATSSAFAVSPGAATKLAFTVQPSAVAAGAAIAPAVQVTVQDAQGNTVTGSTASITLAITSGTGTTGAMLGGTLTQPAVAGVATYANLTVNMVGTGYALTATATTLTGPTSSAFAVSPGAATTISRNGGDDQIATAGTAVSQTPSVKVVDAYGNSVNGIEVTFAVATGGGSVTGAIQITGASGVASVGGWTLGPAAGTNTLTATSAGLNGSPVTFTATGKDPPTSCGQTAFLTIGAARDGNLVSSQCFISSTTRLGVGPFTGPEPGGNHFYDAYLLDIPANTIVRITVSRGSLPVYAILLGYDMAGAPISHAYNAPLVLNNSTAATVRYQVLVTTYVAGDTGTYSIAAEQL